MSNPRPSIEIIPSKMPSQNHESNHQLELLIRIHAPKRPANQATTRPRLNLGLVLDRSGSMAGDRLEYAKAAAKYAVSQLLPTDRISVTIFDHEVETIIPNQNAHQPDKINQRIQSIESRGNTDLQAGWLEGGTQTARGLEPERLNRVLLLSDGETNTGITDQKTICQQVSGLASKGISTSTLGVGIGFNEDLLEAMAMAGDGNYHFIEHPSALEHIFATELNGLLSTFGRLVSLGLESKNNVQVLDVLNDFDKTNTGRYKLDQLRYGKTLEVVVRLEIPKQRKTNEILELRLGYTQTDNQRMVIKHLLSLGQSELEQLPEQSMVREYSTILEVARNKLKTAQNIDAGQTEEALQQVESDLLLLSAIPASPMYFEEKSQLEGLADRLRRNETASARKQALSERYQRSKK